MLSDCHIWNSVQDKEKDEGARTNIWFIGERRKQQKQQTKQGEASLRTKEKENIYISIYVGTTDQTKEKKERKKQRIKTRRSS